MPGWRCLLAPLIVLVLFGGCAASNNKSRIEGRWTFDTPDAPVRGALLDFGSDGIVVLEYPTGVSSGTEPGRPIARVAWRYKLLSGDAVDFYDLDADPAQRLGLLPATAGLARATVRIETTPGGKTEGRAMTLTEADGRTFRLTWVR